MTASPSRRSSVRTAAIAWLVGPKRDANCPRARKWRYRGDEGDAIAAMKPDSAAGSRGASTTRIERREDDGRTPSGTAPTGRAGRAWTATSRPPRAIAAPELPPGATTATGTASATQATTARS